MNSGLLIHVEDPGAANWIVPLVPALTESGPAFTLVCEPALADYFAARGIAAAMLDETTDAPTLLARYKPGLVLVGTSENLASRGLDLIDAARTAGIASAGFVDQSGNAEHRFRGRSGNPLAHAPDWLFVPDDAAAAAFAALGLPDARIIVTGNPHLDRVRAVAHMLAQEGRAPVRARILPDAPADRPVVIFLAEIGYVVNPEAAAWEDALSFAGRSGDAPRCARILEEVLDAIATIAPRPWIVLRLHPKNCRAEFAAYEKEIEAVSEGGDPLALLWAADLVIGMSSSPLEEAYVMGRPVLSVLPHPVERQWLASIASGAIPTVENRSALRTTLPALLAQNDPAAHQEGRPSSAVARIREALHDIAAAA
jgi:hypothetical protein